MTSISIVLGFLIDFIVGDPYNMPHPVRWIGKLISFIEKRARKCKNLVLSGYIIVFVVVIVTGILSFGLIYICWRINKNLAIFVNCIMCFYTLAMRCLKNESMKVAFELENNNIEGARKAVSMIVGRDTQSLDTIGVAKAAVETVAENLSDGVIAPLFYMFIGGGPLAIVYKAVNTMDSMLGYKDEKYIDIGRCCAKLDDIVNFIPSRLSAIFMITATFVLRYDYKNAFKIWKRDRFNHASPNSAQTEAVCAGALNIQLAGDAYYFGKLYKKKFIGDKNRDIEYKDIERTNDIMYVSSVIFLIFGLLVRGIVIWLWF